MPGNGFADQSRDKNFIIRMGDHYRIGDGSTEFELAPPQNVPDGEVPGLKYLNEERT